MSAEFREYTPSEQGFQRLLVRELKEHSLPGEAWKRAGLNFSILTAATVTDLAESHVVDKFLRVPLENRIHKKAQEAAQFEEMSLDDFVHSRPDLKDESLDYIQSVLAAENAKKVEAFLVDRPDLAGKPPEEIRNAFDKTREKKFDDARNMQGKAFAADFVEEWATDGAYTSVANAWTRMATGIPEAKYVSETAAFLSEWGNVISQVALADKLWGKTKFNDVTRKIEPDRGLLGIKLAYKSMDFINPVNVEAAIRLIEDIPVVGNGVTWLHEKSDELLESAWARWGNSALGKAVLGYHIGRNVKPLEHTHTVVPAPHTHTPAAA